MALQDLVRYFEDLVSKGLIPNHGWVNQPISWVVDVDENGNLLGIYSVRIPNKKGDKMLPITVELPAPNKRSSNIAPNFLSDNPGFIVGVEKKGKRDDAGERYKASKELHQRILGSVESDAAKAVAAYFENWDPTKADELAMIADIKKDLLAGGNMTFLCNGEYVVRDPAVREAWQSEYDKPEDGDVQVCLVTGEKAALELVHPAIKKIAGSDKSQMALVSNNFPASQAYGHEQGACAPISKREAFAFSYALNMLLTDFRHKKEFGDLTVVYWASGADEQYTDMFSAILDGTGNETISDEMLNDMMTAMSKGENYLFENLPLSPSNDFHILGLTPSGSRMSVRFYYRSKYGDIVNHYQQHFKDLEIINDNHSPRWWASLRTLLLETVNQNVDNPKPDPYMANCVFDAMLFGGLYPEAMMSQTMMRIRAERNISRGKAGMIKAYLLRNTNKHPDREQLQEVATVALNEESNYTPYVLGRLFSVLEGVQLSVNPDVGRSVKDRFFSLASIMPNRAFPTMLKLSQHHLRKLKSEKPGYAVNLSKQIGELTDRIYTFPVRLTLQEQGAFALGYYHQTQKRFEKKTKTEEEKANA